MSDIKPCPVCDGEIEMIRAGTPRVSQQYRCEDCGLFFECNETHGSHRLVNSRPAEEQLRARLAEAEKQIEDLKAEHLAMRCCGNCEHDTCAGGFDWSEQMRQNTNCIDNNFKHWRLKNDK